MQKTHIIVLDSADRISGDSSDFVVKISPACEAPKIIELLAVNIPLTMYNVTSSNNIIPLWTGFPSQVFHAVIIPPGNYTIDELIVAVAMALTVASGQIFSCTYSSPQKFRNLMKKFTIPYSLNNILL